MYFRLRSVTRQTSVKIIVVATSSRYGVSNLLVDCYSRLPAAVSVFDPIQLCVVVNDRPFSYRISPLLICFEFAVSYHAVH